MRGRGGRGRGWRNSAGEMVSPDPFPAPQMNTQASAGMDFYQQDMSNTGSVDMSGNEVLINIPVAQAVVSDSDVSMQEGEQQTESRKRPWERQGGTKVKRKKVPGAKNLKIRRYIQPKNAVMCLNELRPGVVYGTEHGGGVGQPFCVSVEIDGQKYRGYGSSKQLAKQAAAEAALISFVKPPVSASTEGQEEDKTPWATLASFAMYKLFNDWREGRVGMCPPPTQPYGAAIPPGCEAFLNQAMGQAGNAVKDEFPQASAFTEAICAHLGTTGRTNSTDTKQPAEPVKVPNPAKQVPENAAGMHPVMVLHQMRPGVQYNINQTSQENKPFFSVTIDVDGKEFVGEGPNVKKAKFNLAKKAILGLYGVDSTFEA